MRANGEEGKSEKSGEEGRLEAAKSGSAFGARLIVRGYYVLYIACAMLF